MRKYKVLLTASGIGSRLGDLTKFTNKSLVSIGNKPAIAHIIEQYPEDVEIVITLGYFGSHVKQFLQIAYPNRKFTFVEVENYDGPGSSLGWSQLCAKDHLQCPFIYNACDTIVSSKIKEFSGNHNWVGAKKGTGSSQYDSITVGPNNEIVSFHDKGYIGSTHYHIGLIGISNYSDYWETLERLYRKNPDDRSLNDMRVIKDCLSNGTKWQIVEFDNWFDIGNVSALKKARNHWKDELNVLEKIEESISLVDGKVIKFFHNEDIVKKRVLRGSLLKGLTPNIKSFSENFYSYDFIKGPTASDVMTPEKMKSLIKWADKNLWKDSKSIKDFKSHAMYFYKLKTESRIQKFLQKYPKEFIGKINGLNIPDITSLLAKIPWEFLCNSTPSQFHGDFILDNIVIKDDGSFVLIDWRHDFGDGCTHAGDLYYDLAKMNHNLTVNHDIVCKNLFEISVDKEEIKIDILRKDSLVKCNETFIEEIQKLGYNKNKVEMLTGLVWLNMAPLHHHPFDQFLFYYGKLKLFLALEEYYA